MYGLRRDREKNGSKLDSAVHSLVTKSIWAGRNTPLISGCHFQQSLSPLPWRSRGIPVVEPQHGYCHLRGTTLEKRICLHMFFNQTEQTQSFYILLYNLLKEASWTKKKTTIISMADNPTTLSSKERATCAWANGLLSTRPLCFVKLTPGEWDNAEFHPQAERAIPQVSSWPLLQRHFPEVGTSWHTFAVCGPNRFPSS